MLSTSEVKMADGIANSRVERVFGGRRSLLQWAGRRRAENEEGGTENKEGGTELKSGIPGRSA